MYWQEEQDESQFVVPDDIVDLVFGIECRTLPVDHAHALSEAVRQALPWFPEEEEAGLHAIHVADSGNGWERPEDGSELLYLSRRTKLTLRLPKHRIEAAKDLSGRRFNVAGHEMVVGNAKPKLLSVSSTLYARYVFLGEAQDEESFLAEAVSLLRSEGLRFKKVLCGKTTEIITSTGSLSTRSLLVADLGLEDSVRLQQRGIGHHRKMGCGLFIPHKSI